MHMTNIAVTAQGWKTAPCLALGTTEFPASGHVMIDHETENGIIEDGQPNDVARVAARCNAEMLRIRNSTRARICWYGWPYPREESHVERFAARFGPMVSRSDWLAPCCYVSSSGGEIERGSLFRRCVTLMRCRSKDAYGCISDWTLDSTRPVTDDEWILQCRAARAAGCVGVYLWTGMEYRVWASGHFSSVNPKVKDEAARAWAELLGMWGFTGLATAKNIESERRRVGVAMMRKAETAWRESK